MGRGAGRCLQLQGSESIGGRSARRVHARRATGHVTTVTRARACSKHSIAVACADSGADSEPRPEAPGEDRRARNDAQLQQLQARMDFLIPS